MKTAHIFIVTLVSFVLQSDAASGEEWKTVLQKALRRIPSIQPSEKLDGSQLSVIRTSVSSFNDFDRTTQGWDGILALFASGDLDYLTLTWYRQSNRSKRALIFALFLCYEPNFITEEHNPRFQDFFGSLRRFSDREADARREECLYVIDNAASIAKEIAQLEAALDIARRKRLTLAVELITSQSGQTVFTNMRRKHMILMEGLDANRRE